MFKHQKFLVMIFVTITVVLVTAAAIWWVISSVRVDFNGIAASDNIISAKQGNRGIGTDNDYLMQSRLQMQESNDLALRFASSITWPWRLLISILLTLLATTGYFTWFVLIQVRQEIPNTTE